MRYGIYSDIHGNLEALTSVLKAYEDESIDEYICLGDVVGYGANPNECVELVRQNATVVLAGNHDYAALELTDIRHFNPYAKHAVLWTRDVLSKKNMNYLRKRELSHHFENDNFMVVHATPSQPEAWNYIFSRYEAKYEFRNFTEQICFIGHSHTPMVIRFCDGEIDVIPAQNGTDVIELMPDSRYIINVGSVGQPRDRNPLSAYCVFDATAHTVQIKRIEYDIKTAQQKILAANLPYLLAERLATGD
ncbi:MAG: metallophosphoesterase [Gemmatimonadetes bacterium]|nr:MAG: metallophosphoesterase [Gemmatimonadota bacterium]